MGKARGLLAVLACESVGAAGRGERGRVGGEKEASAALETKTRGHWKVLDPITDNTGPACVSLRLRASLGLVTNSTGPILKLL